MKEYGSNQPAAFHGGSGRLLLSDGSLENQLLSPSPRAWFLFNLLGWFSRLLVIGFIFLKLFVFGEPSLRPESGVAAKFWAFKRQADLATKRVCLFTNRVSGFTNS